MRVIAGSLRGHKLSSPEGINTRPTLDRVKEAVFSMLMPYLSGAVVLDLFAGSGSMGIESISRGAEKAIFVDNDQAAIACINCNIKSCGIIDSAEIFQKDALSFLSDCQMKFDIIFLDPPYFKDIYSAALDAIHKRNLLTDDGIIVVEWDYAAGFENTCSGFVTIKEKKYGRVGITTLKRGIF